MFGDKNNKIIRDLRTKMHHLLKFLDENEYLSRYIMFRDEKSI